MTAATAPAEDAPYGANVEQELTAITNRSATQSPPLEPPAPDDGNPCNGRIHSRTPSGSNLSVLGSDVNTDATTPQNAVMSPGSNNAALTDRHSYLDTSALSPQEYAVYLSWSERIKPAHSGRPGLLDEHSAVKFLRSEFGINSEDEVKIMCLFERLPFGLLPGHFFAMVRLAAWAQQGKQPASDLIFTQSAFLLTSRTAPHAPPQKVCWFCGQRRDAVQRINPCCSTVTPFI